MHNKAIELFFSENIVIVNAYLEMFHNCLQLHEYKAGMIFQQNGVQLH